LKQKILVYLDYQFIHFYIAKYLQNQDKFDLFGIIDLNDKPKRFFSEQKIVDFKKTWDIRGEVRNDLNHPDLKYLKEFEEKYGINLWSIAFAERKFYREFNEYYDFEYNEILSILEKECKFYESILSEINPNFLLISATDWHHMYLLTEMCKSKKIKVLMLDLAKIGKKCRLNDDFEYSTTKKESNSLRTFNELQNYLKNESRASQAKAEATEFGGSFKMKIKAFYELFFKYDSNYTKHYTNFGKTPLNMIFNEIRKIFKTKYRENFLKNNTKINLDIDRKIIYYPLHFEPERVLLIDSPQYTNQLEVILNIAKSLPVNHTLFVKEHPVMKVVGWRKTSFYQEILDMPNVILLDPFLENEKILKKCSLVITITGTTAIEAAFYEKPSIVLGKIWGESQLASSLLKITNIEDLPNTIQKALKQKININELNSYVDWIEENTFDFNHNRYVLDLWNKFYFGGNLVNVDIGIEDMMKFLNSKSNELDIVCDAHIKEIQKMKL
jgi:hypothetical protein